MKVLIQNDSPGSAHTFTRAALAKTLMYCGHSVILWNIWEKPAFDVFDEFEPDWFYGDTYNCNKGVFQCLIERPHMFVTMRAPDWGEFWDNIDISEYEMLFAQPKEVEIIEDLREQSGHPNFLHNHYHKDDIFKTESHWINKGFKVVSNREPADPWLYTNGEFREEFKADIAWISSSHKYKNKTIDKFLKPLFYFPEKYDIKWYSQSQIGGFPQHVGWISPDLNKHALKSATINISINDPHHQDFGIDRPYRLYYTLLNKCFMVSQYIESVATKEFLNDEVVWCHTPEEFKEKIDYFLSNPNERFPYIERGYKTVLNEHTSFHRLSDLFKHLGLDQESKQCMSRFKDLKNELSL